MMNGTSICKVFSFALLFSFLPGQANALSPAQVFDKVKDSIVVVKTLDSQGNVKVQGSGVILPSGKIATNSHVVAGGSSYLVGRGKKLANASLYGIDEDLDICLLDANDFDGKPAQVGKATNLKVGDTVYAVGAPQGLELSLSDGIVSQLRGEPPPLIQTTAAISPGSSGGGLFDENGRLVGLVTLFVKGGQNLNFAVPVEWIDNVKPGENQVAGVYGEYERLKMRAAFLRRFLSLNESGDWDGLVDLCQKRLQVVPNESDTWYFLGMANLNLDRYTEAMKAFLESLRIDPGDSESWRVLGIAYISLKRYNDAIGAARESLRINPNHPGAWRILGDSYAKVDRFNDSIEAYRESLRLDPDNAKTWFQLGSVFYLVDNRTEALDVVRELRRLDSKMADILFGLVVPR